MRWPSTRFLDFLVSELARLPSKSSRYKKRFQFLFLFPKNAFGKQLLKDIMNRRQLSSISIENSLVEIIIGLHWPEWSQMSLPCIPDCVDGRIWDKSNFCICNIGHFLTELRMQLCTWTGKELLVQRWRRGWGELRKEHRLVDSQGSAKATSTSPKHKVAWATSTSP